jgi:hypothetical protein
MSYSRSITFTIPLRLTLHAMPNIVPQLTPQAAVARASALVRAQKRSANPPKTRAPKLRGKKAQRAAASSGEKQEDVIELD